MNLNRVYYDSDGKECNIIQMITHEPFWAANVIQKVTEKWVKVREVAKWYFECQEARGWSPVWMCFAPEYKNAWVKQNNFLWRGGKKELYATITAAEKELRDLVEREGG